MVYLKPLKKGDHILNAMSNDSGKPETASHTPILLDLTSHDQAKLDMYDERVGTPKGQGFTNIEILEYNWLQSRRVAYDEQIKQEELELRNRV